MFTLPVYLYHSTVVLAVDWQYRGCQFKSHSLLYKCYW